MASRAIFITGATGKQGGAVVNALLKQNAPFEIIAVTRDSQSASAQRLAQKSPKIKLVSGDLNNIEQAFQKAKEVTSTPIWGVFSVQLPGGKEEAQGKALVDAALKNGVKHFVYTSVQRGPNTETTKTDIPHFISKFNIEEHLRSKSKGSDMSWTILRPVGFYDNVDGTFFGKVFGTSFSMLLKGTGKKLQLVATSDIGHAAAEAYVHADSEQYKNQSIPLAGEELTYEEFKEIFEKHAGQPLPETYWVIGSIIHLLVADLRLMFKWFRDTGFNVDIAEVKKTYPEVKTFKQWLETESIYKK